MDNGLEDSPFKGKLHIELLVFGDGLAVYMKSGILEPIAGIESKRSCADTML
jgi:hypothetical protein